MTSAWISTPAFLLPETAWGWVVFIIVAFVLYRRFTARNVGKSVGNYRAASRVETRPPAALNARDEALAVSLKALDLAPGATYEQVKAAYRELVKIWHPDRFANDAKLKARANAKLIEINAAYEKLKTHFES